MRALTLTQPWAGLVASGIKLVENRPRAMGADKMIGERIAIHASRQIDEAVYTRIGQIAPELPGRTPAEWGCKWWQLSRVTSAIIGVATIEKVIEPQACGILPFDPVAASPIVENQRRWFFGPVGIRLRDVYAIEPIRDVKGALGFWQLDLKCSRELQLRRRAA